ncbi:hypothetical protein P7C70_g6711, partial [Phenoliferia sp. Uapishka_3]
MSTVCRILPTSATPPQYITAPGLGPGGHASEEHLPPIHDDGNEEPLWFQAICPFCKHFKSSRTKTEAAAAGQWRNRHAALHGIHSWDLAIFHPSLPHHVVPSTFPRHEAHGLVYFASRSQAREILAYAALIGESRQHARTFTRLTPRPGQERGRLPGNESWAASVIPADPIASLYRRTRFTSTVASHPLPRNKNTDAFRGLTLSGFNESDAELIAFGEDSDSESLGYLLWFWVFAVRVRHRTLVEQGALVEHDEAWETYRKAIYTVVSHTGLRKASPTTDLRADTSTNQIWHYIIRLSRLPEPYVPHSSLEWSLFDTLSLPAPRLSELPPSTALLPLQEEVFLLPLQARICALVASSLEKPSVVDAESANNWIDMLGRGLSESETWVHIGWARSESIEERGWPRLLEVWNAFTEAERSSWGRRKDPRLESARVTKAAAAQLRLSSHVVKHDKESSERSLGAVRKLRHRL